MSQPIQPEPFDVPALGIVAWDERHGAFASDPIYVPILGRKCRIILGDYIDGDPNGEVNSAVASFLGLGQSKLREADEFILLYSKDYEKYYLELGGVPLNGAEELWRNVTFGDEPTVSRRNDDDRVVYISIECECSWEEEHGLQLIFKDGARISKLGPYDGSLTNSDAFGDPRLENVIYAR